jgi:hypothetical protein
LYEESDNERRAGMSELVVLKLSRDDAARLHQALRLAISDKRMVVAEYGADDPNDEFWVTFLERMRVATMAAIEAAREAGGDG